MSTPSREELARLAGAANARQRTEGQTRAMIKDVAFQFNEIHKADAVKYDNMAQAINVLAVRIDVLIDILTDPRPIEAEGLPKNKLEKFYKLCEAKNAVNEKMRAEANLKA